MRRTALAVVACALTAVAPAQAQERPAPPVDEVLRLLSLEEEVEVMELRLEARKAPVRAAEQWVAVMSRQLKLIEPLGGKGLEPALSMMRAEADLEKAKAELEVRAAELKEAEVRLKYARKRLEAAKAAGARPADPKDQPGRKPDELRPTNMARNEPLRFVPRSADELKAQLARSQAATAAQVLRLKRAQAEVRAAEDELAALTDRPAGGAPADEIKAAQAKFDRAVRRLDEIDRDYRAAQATADTLRRALEAVEKGKP